VPRREQLREYLHFIDRTRRHRSRQFTGGDASMSPAKPASAPYVRDLARRETSELGIADAIRCSRAHRPVERRAGGVRRIAHSIVLRGGWG